MKKLTQNVFGGLFVASVLALVALFSPIAPSASAQGTQPVTGEVECPEGQYSAQIGVDCAQPTGAPTTLFGAGSIFTAIVNVLLFIIGAISVIMLIVGGIRYTISNGDSGAVTSAKNTILYAIVGLIIAFLAFAIVNFVLATVTPAGTTGNGA